MRFYPSAMYACNKTSNYDTAQDPLAGLENMNFIQLMTSKRYKKRLESQMFWEMFRYIQGVNEVNYVKERYQYNSFVVRTKSRLR